MPEKKQTTWGGRFAAAPADLMIEFGESVSFDARLAPYDVACSRAHARMLAASGLLTEAERDAILKGLAELEKAMQTGDFPWRKDLEDVHMNIEHRLREKVPAAAKLHTARSRNDQVATDMRLFFKDATALLRDRIHQVQVAFVDLAEEYQETLIPGYTHLQRAQPYSLAHHLLAYVEMLERDADRFSVMGKHANQCPLGSGAIAGTTLPIDRAFAALELGFVDSKGQPCLTRNSVDAVSDRDLFIEFASAGALLAVHLSRLAEDFILWNSAEFGFIRLPDTFTTGSSLMPQKKNPDALELIRGKAARIQGNLQTLILLLKAQPLSYNRDLQEDKPPVFDTFDQSRACLEVLAAMLPETAFDRARCDAAVADPLLLATDLADYLVERGVPFRDAHHRVGALVALAEERAVPLPRLKDAEATDACPELGQDWRQVFDLRRAMERRKEVGMPSPDRVREALAAWRRKWEAIPGG